MKLNEIAQDPEQVAIHDWFLEFRRPNSNEPTNDNDFTVKAGMIYVLKDDVYLNNHKLKSLPYQFAPMPDLVFKVHSNELTSLVNCPKKCKEFDADKNNLTNLEGGPEETSGQYTAWKNKLTSLKGCPKFVGEDFDVSDNQLTEIDFAPEIILGDFNIAKNKITSLKDIHKKCHQCNGHIVIGGTPISKAILGVILIDHLESLSVIVQVAHSMPLLKAAAIVNKYLGKGKAGVLDAQNELIEAGLDDFAEL